MIFLKYLIALIEDIFSFEDSERKSRSRQSRGVI